MPHLAGPNKRHPDVDGGWAWAVLLATTLWNFILGGTIKSFGLLFVELQNIFPENTPAQVGLISLVTGISATVFSPVAGWLSDMYSSRCLAIIGSLVTAAGLLATGFVSSLYGAIITYGIIFGGGMGIMDGPILAMIGKYWEKRRNIASGVSFSGSSVGNLALAPLIALLIDRYSVRGSFFILAGIWLNGCVVGALLRPFHSFKRDQAVLLVKPDPEHGQDDRNSTSARCNHTQTCINKETRQKNTDISVDEMGNVEQSGDIQQRLCNGLCKPEVIRSCKNCDTNGDKKGDNAEEICDRCAEKQKLHQDCDECETDSSDHATDNSTCKDCSSLTQKIKLSLKLNNKCICCYRKGEPSPSTSNCIKFFVNKKLLVNLFVVTCGMFGYYMPIIALPAYCKELGYSLYQSAGLISILSIVEVVSRLIISTVVDVCHLKPPRVLITSYLVIGLLTQLALFLPSGHVMVAYACAHGMLGGLCLVFMTAMLVDAVGVTLLGSAMGLAVVSLNLTSSLAAVISGLMREYTGSYGSAIRLSACVYLLGASVYIIVNTAIRLTSRHTQQDNHDLHNDNLPEIEISNTFSSNE